MDDLDYNEENYYKYIDDNLILGNIWATESDVIQKESIDSVLSVCSDVKINADIKNRLVIEIDDSFYEANKMLQNLPQCINFIDNELKKGYKVLVHCNGGISRSASVIIGYLMKKNQISYEEAFQIVKEKKNNIKPNLGFEIMLKNDFEKICIDNGNGKL